MTYYTVQLPKMPKLLLCGPKSEPHTVSQQIVLWYVPEKACFVTFECDTRMWHSSTTQAYDIFDYY